MKLPKFIYWAFGILVLINVVLLFLLFRHPMHGRPPHLHPQGKGDFKHQIVEELQLDDKQQALYFSSVSRHRKSMDSIEQMEHQQRERIFADPAHISCDSCLKNMQNYEPIKIKITIKHLLELKQILHENQVNKFDAVYAEFLQKLTGRPPHPLGPPPPAP